MYVTFQNVENVTENTNEVIEPQTIINEIVNKFNKNNFDLYKGYDLFVASVIQAVFDGKIIKNLETWNLKKIVELFEKQQINGTEQKRNITNIQPQLFF